VAAQAAVVVACLALMPGVWREVGGGAAFMGRGADLVVSSAGEARGLLGDGLEGAAGRLTWMAVAFPLAVALVAWGALRRRAAAGDWLVVVWAVVAAGLAWSQGRFAVYLSVPLALCLGALACGLWEAAARCQSRTRRLCRASLVLVAVAAAGSPWTRWGRRVELPRWELSRVLPALDWLRTESAPGGAIDDFATPPPYAVMAHWHYGHWLTYVAERANVACPFGNTAQHRLGLERYCAFFGARSEDAAAELCEQLGVRYILSTDFFLPVVLVDLGLDPRRFREADLMATSLQLRRGLRAPGSREPLTRFRLVAEFVGILPGGEQLATRLFEFVPGARVAGKAPGRGRVELTLTLADARGETLVYRVSTRANEGGGYTLRVPYSTAAGRSPFRAPGPARVRWTDAGHERSARVAIQESDVLSARVVPCDLL
jgi:asparagine N-glycosylation enzyme membrane subunit Stt3